MASSSLVVTRRLQPMPVDCDAACCHLWALWLRPRIQAYILPGKAPMLVVRPIMKAVGLVLDCKHGVQLDDEPWQEIIVGLHDE